MDCATGEVGHVDLAVGPDAGDNQVGYRLGRRKAHIGRGRAGGPVGVHRDAPGRGGGSAVQILIQQILQVLLAAAVRRGFSQLENNLLELLEAQGGTSSERRRCASSQTQPGTGI